MKKITVSCYIRTNKVGSECADEIEVEVDPALSPEERDEEIEHAVREHLFGCYLEWGYDIVKEQ